MTWKTWATAMSLGVMLTAAAPTAKAFDRNDVSSTVTMDKAADIVDLYAWMEPSNGNRMYLIMTVFPNADKMLSRFSPDILYVFHTYARSTALDPMADAEVPITCKFDTVIGTQGFECWAGKEYLKGKVGATGQASRTGALQVFAGPRNDPFFMNETSLNNAMTVGANSIQTIVQNGTKDAAKCVNFSTTQSMAVRSTMSPAGSMDSYRTQTVLAIVISIDPLILAPGNKKVVSVWASTNRPL